jgi:hypothetical protein
MVLEEEGRVTSCVDRRIISWREFVIPPCLLIHAHCSLIVEDLVTGDSRTCHPRILLLEIFCFIDEWNKPSESLVSGHAAGNSSMIGSFMVDSATLV